MKILVIKSSSMGDIIHALPVARDIRKALPDARIDWVAEESFRDGGVKPFSLRRLGLKLHRFDERFAKSVTTLCWTSKASFDRQSLRIGRGCPRLATAGKPCANR